MGCDLTPRDVYLPAGAAIDLAAATAEAARLCQTATVDELRSLLENGWIHDAGLGHTGGPPAVFASRADAGRAAAGQRRHQLVDDFTQSLHRRDVARFRVDRPGDGGPGVHAYVTGGLSAGDSPTDSFDDWDIVFDADRFPPGRVDRI